MKLRKIGKKGALDVSINAIVVIIFAITFLALGLTFIKETFGKVQDKVDKEIGADQLSIKPTAENPIVILPSEFDISRGKSKTLDLAVFNGVSDDVKIEAKWQSGCILSDSSVNAKNGIKLNDIATFKMIASIPVTSVVGDTKICSVEVTITPSSGTPTVLYQDVVVTVSK